MDYKKSFRDLFKGIPKPIIGMIHLAGENYKEKIERVKEELNIFEEEGINGALFENYHGTLQDVFDALGECMYLNKNVVLGANILRNPYEAFQFTESSYFSWRGVRFIQFDSVQTKDLEKETYASLRKEFPCVVLGGVGFKYTGETGNSLDRDLVECMPRCEAIVTTGSGTGIETPLSKLKDYRKEMDKIQKSFPLIVGAGLTADNAYEQLMIADGAIVGCFLKKDGKTENEVSQTKTHDLMKSVKEVRRDWAYSL